MAHRKQSERIKARPLPKRIQISMQKAKYKTNIWHAIYTHSNQFSRKRHKNSERLNDNKSGRQMYRKRSTKLILNSHAYDGSLKHKRNAVQKKKAENEITSFLNLPTDINEIVSARPETLQVYSFNNGDGEYDQLIMKAPRKLKCDVSNKFLKKPNKNKFESNYETKPKQP